MQKKKKREREKEKHITNTGTPRHKPDYGILVLETHNHIDIGWLVRSAGCHYPVNHTSKKITREDFVHIHYIQSPFANEADGKKDKLTQA